MCTRFQTPRDLERLKDRFGSQPTFNFAFNPNLPITGITPILCSDENGLHWALARFGMIPQWQKTIKGKVLHNARSETVRTLPAFKTAYSKRRCIIPAEGYYEWREEGEKKMPYLFSRKDGELVCIAGIFSDRVIENERVVSFAMLTGEPMEFSLPYHDRQPLITDNVEAWLDFNRDSLERFDVVPSNAFQVTPMNPAMNRTGSKDVRIL